MIALEIMNTVIGIGILLAVLATPTVITRLQNEKENNNNGGSDSVDNDTISNKQ